MAKISTILDRGPAVSFEFFPPRTEEAETVLAQTLRDLEPLAPSFVSVTYGAGGTTRERTHDLVVQINRETSMTAMAHLTCAAHSRAELEGIVDRYRDAGVENILALGGDPPTELGLPEGELHHAIDLVRLARGRELTSIGVAVHPEPHPASPSIAVDRAHSAEKLAEADFAITQFFFDSHHYFDLVDALRERGVDRPVIPGIMPVLSIAGTKRMTEMQGSEFPEWFMAKLREVEDDPAEVRKIGIAESTNLCRELLEGGAPGLHFFTLNRSTATREIYENLDLDRELDRELDQEA